MPLQNKQNLHMHTTYADGKNAPEELVLEAINRNFDSIGFSEHTYLQYSSYPHQMMTEDMPCLLSAVIWRSRWRLMPRT